MALLTASVWMHSVVGWGSLAAALATASVAPDLVASLEAGWLFGAVPLLVTAVLLAIHLRRPEVGTALALRVIGAALALYGVLCVIRYDGNLFFVVFIVMGGGTLLAAGGGSRTLARVP